MLVMKTVKAVLAVCLLSLIWIPVYAAYTNLSLAIVRSDSLDRALINNSITLLSQHSVYIVNNSAITNSYTYTFSQCAATQGCISRAFTIYITAHGQFNLPGSGGVNTYYLPLVATFTAQGSYATTATTAITGTDGTNILVTSKGTVSVNNPFDPIRN